MAKVLIVDDIRSEVQLIANVLAPEGYECIQANTGVEAMERARAERPDLILLDVVMPGQDGFATCRQLKRDSVTKDIPVVIVTSKDGESDRFWGQRQGAAEYLAKPFGPSDLLALVRRFA
jgi:twitching motility two-component system response regulator PilH